MTELNLAMILEYCSDQASDIVTWEFNVENKIKMFSRIKTEQLSSPEMSYELCAGERL